MRDMKTEKIVSIEEITTPEEQDVYDLEVSGFNTFFANDILVHNTDSIFLHIDPVLRSILGEAYDSTEDDDKVELTLEIIRACANYINTFVVEELSNKHNTPSQDTHFSKHNFSFKEELIIKRCMYMNVKKKYASWIINKEGKKTDKLNIVGMEVVRSDYAPFTKRMMSDVINAILRQGAGRSEITAKVSQYLAEYKKLLSEGNPEVGVPCGWGLREYEKPTKAIRGMTVYNELVPNGKKFCSGDRGYMFDLERVWSHRIPEYNKKAQKLVQSAIIPKTHQPDVIVIHENEKLDTSIFAPSFEKMLELCVFRRLEPILFLLQINVSSIL